MRQFFLQDKLSLTFISVSILFGFYQAIYFFMDSDFEFWGPFEYRTTKNPKKGKLVATYYQLLSKDQAETVIGVQCWFYPNQQADSQALNAIMQMKNAKQIGIYGRNSDTISKVDFKIPPLTKLRICSCLLTQIPPYVFQSPNMISLILNSNKIASIPAQIENLANLKELSLFQNDLHEFPAPILKLFNLQELSINFNFLPEIPEQIGDLKKLRRIFFNNNPDLKTMPKAVWTHLKALKAISVANTPYFQNPASKPKMDELKRRGILIV